MVNDIEAIMSPKSIAVVGATNRPGSVGLAIFSNILNGGYQGVLYPVHPTAKSIHGVRAYPRLKDVPDDIDLAVIIVPAEAVLSVVEEAAQRNVKGAIVVSSGFSEVKGRGAKLEARLKYLVQKNGLRLVGPNCFGVINTNAGVQMNASFARKMPKSGNIALITQSGPLGTAALDFAERRGIGFSKLISLGNKADINESDLLRYLRNDPDTDVILMYLDEITDGQEFMEAAREVTWGSRKPILAIKSGRSSMSDRTAISHTGSLAGSDSAYDAVFLQSGIQRVGGVEDLFNHAIAFANQPTPKNNQIAIITNVGGPNTMAIDAVTRHGLVLASLSDGTQKKLRRRLSQTADIENPVTIIGDATHECCESVIRDVLIDEEVKGAIIILMPQAMSDIMETVKVLPRAIRKIDKPVLCSLMGVVDVSEGIRYLEKHGIPHYTFPEEAVSAMASMQRFADRLRLQKREVQSIDADHKTAARIIKDKLGDWDSCYLPENEANEILKCYGFPMLDNILIKDSSQIKRAIEVIGLPVAMKISSPNIIHKFEMGGVRLKLKTIKEAQQAYKEILANTKRHTPSAKINGVLIEKMARGGIEVILGAVRDPQIGPICMFGLGGKFVETIRDVTFRLAPMWEITAERMIRSIKAYRILRGVRGIPPADIDAIKDCILRLSQMVCDHPEIAELDINPLIVYPKGKGCVVADSSILLSRVKE